MMNTMDMLSIPAGYITEQVVILVISSHEVFGSNLWRNTCMVFLSHQNIF